MPSATRTELAKWLSGIEVEGRTLDIGGNVYSIKGKVKSFKGEYEILGEEDFDLNQLGHFPTRFDNIFATEVMQFIFSPTDVLQNFYDLLSKNGNLYISFHLTHPPMKGHDYLRYTTAGATKLLETAGFNIVDFSSPVDGYYLVKCTRR